MKTQIYAAPAVKGLKEFTVSKIIRSQAAWI